MDNNPANDFVVYEKYKNPRNNIYGKSMSDTTKYNQGKAQNSELKLEDALAMSSYPKYLLDFIKQFLIDNYAENDVTTVYLLTGNEENIFLIKYELTIELNKKFYKVFLLVYLPILFPNYPPEIYIEKTANIAVNKCYLNGRINENDLKINIDNFVKFDPNKNNIGEIIDNLLVNFTQDFPVYRVHSGPNLVNSGKCVFDKSKANKIILPEKNSKKNYSMNYLIEDADYIMNKDKKKYGNVNNKNLKNDGNGRFDDKTFLDFIKNQTKDIVRYRFLEFKEKFNINSNLDNLKKLDNESKERLSNDKAYTKNEKLQTQLNSLKNINVKLHDIENKINNEIKEFENNNKKSVLDKCEDLIMIANKKDLDYLIRIKVMEDYLVYLKKGYEKKIVGFDDMLNLTRSFSREIFNLNYMRSKLKKYN